MKAFAVSDLRQHIGDLVRNAEIEQLSVVSNTVSRCLSRCLLLIGCKPLAFCGACEQIGAKR